jgi:nucleotide-binding universal stress UspA family protein
MYKKILVGYDTQRHGEMALSEAVRLAKITGGEIILVSSAELDQNLIDMSPEMSLEKEITIERKLLDAAGRTHEKGIQIDMEFYSAKRPHKAIIETALDKKADLIVLCSHGRSGFLRLLMGSTSERVISFAPCPVLVVKLPAGSDSYKKEN